MHFEGNAPGDEHVDEEAYRDTEGILPASVNKILSDLSFFPNLGLVSIEFPFHFADSKEWDEGLDVTQEEESDEEVKSEEGKIAWRAFMAKTYEALGRNKKCNLKAIEIRQLSPKKVSTFKSPFFHKFLSQLKHFYLSVYGEDNGAGWKINRHCYSTALMGKLGICFLDHLTFVTNFVLKAPAEGPLGIEEASETPLKLRPRHMPCLRILHLEYILIGQELIDFLVGHTKPLESLSMRNCAAIVSYVDNPIHWKTLFDALHVANFENLRSLSVAPDRVPQTVGEVLNKEEEDSEVSDEVKEERQILERDPKRRLFAYVTIDDKYGAMDEDEEENVEAFRRGEDQTSYEKLMSIIEANVERSETN